MDDLQKQLVDIAKSTSTYENGETIFYDRLTIPANLLYQMGLNKEMVNTASYLIQTAELAPLK